MRDNVLNHATTDSHKRTLRAACFALVIAAAATAGFASAGDTPPFAENGPVETAQFTLWIGAALFALILALPQRTFADRAAMVTVGIAAAAAAAREIDAHVLLNPETIGDFGVRYRIDWWLDGSVSPLRKLAWAAIALAVAGVVVTATIAAHFHPILALKRRSRAVIYFAAAAVCMALGFTFDDLLRNRIPLAAAQAAEESVEVLAPLFYLAAANHLAVSALAGRRADLHRRASHTLTPCPSKQKSSPSQRST